MAAEATLGGAVEMRGRLKFFLQSVSVLLVVCCNPQGEPKLLVFSQCTDWCSLNISCVFKYNFKYYIITVREELWVYPS